MQTHILENGIFQCFSKVLLMSGLCFIVSCGRNGETTGDSPVVNSAATTSSVPDSTESNNEDRTEAYKAAMARAEKAGEERRRNPPRNEIALPNFEAGPGRPYPIGINFYRIDDRYPNYLQCRYMVSENNYDQTNEPQWFEAALLQIRGTGPERFPPIEWVAVIIQNVAEHKDRNNFEQTHKAGAIFAARDVFHIGRDLRQSISEAKVDRHPFQYDRQQPTPGKQQRWSIVERHASTNQATSGATQR